ncbi:Nitroreductase-like protein [Ilyonectria destructans]|nr:Nitroreductase-like protein [Ilyonectria destructans]
MGTQLSLDEYITKRHSTRGFLKTPVPRALIEQSLDLAQHAPSNSNIQPWRLVIVSGPGRDRLSNALLAAAASQGKPNIPELPQAFRHYRSDLGRALFGGVMGIPRDDSAARLAAELRNYDFFGAPTVAIVTMDKELGAPDSLSVGMYLQLLLLALDKDGIESCVQVSVAGYPEVLRKELDIPANQEVICGVSLGYPDPAYKGNIFRAKREPFTEVARFVDA